MSGFEDCCACCFALCCIGGVETMNTWCLFTSCGSGGNGGCCGSCCKRRFDDDSFEQEEAVRFQQGDNNSEPFLPNPHDAVAAQPSPRPSMSEVPAKAEGGVKEEVQTS